MDSTDRYVVVIWFYDHWAITDSTNDLVAAQATAALAKGKVPRVMVLDTTAAL